MALVAVCRELFQMSVREAMNSADRALMNGVRRVVVSMVSLSDAML